MINWDKVYKLSANEFSEDPDKFADPQLIYSLGNLRKQLKNKMRPSPVKGTLARHTGSEDSQHFVGPEINPIRKSKASDVFCEGYPFQTLSIVLSTGHFNGVGVYLDTKGPDGLPWVMFHLDIRPNGFATNLPLIWIVEKVYDAEKDKKVYKYRYPQFDPQYWKLFNDKKLFKSKQFGVRTT